MTGWERQQRTREALWVACSRIGRASHDDVLAALDAIDTHDLPRIDIATWLNNRAYVLALRGNATEALEHLEDAAEVLAAIDDDVNGDFNGRHTAGELGTRYQRAILASCIIGTRGIAQLHGGMFDEAEANLGKALALDVAVVESADPDVQLQARALTAERLWWLALIAEKRGDQALRVVRLRRAAQLTNTEYGERARGVLER